jgi:hypothetical protein
MAPEGGGVAQLDGPQRPALPAVEGLAIAIEEGLAILAHHIGDLELGSVPRGGP